MTQTRTLRLVGFSVVALLGFAGGCKPRAFNEATSDMKAASIPSGQRLSEKNFCAAVRGNGEMIMAHMSSLGRLVDEVELIDGFAGGSSASISAFIYESMIANPAVWNCKTGRCSKGEVRQRVSFLLKSTWQLMQFLSESKEVINLLALNQARVDAQAAGASLEKLIDSGKLTEASSAVSQLVQSRPLRDLTNPEFQSLFNPKGKDGKPKTAALHQHHLRIALEALKTFGKFELKKADGFFRPGLISFEGLANKIGYIGDLYAGRMKDKNKKAMTETLNNCADKHAGQRWMTFAKAQPQCALAMKSIIDDELKSPLQHNNRRIDEQIGLYMPALAITSVFTGDEAKKSEEYIEKYLNGTLNDTDRNEYKIFNRLNVGYWGQPDDTNKLDSKRSDLKSTMRMSLGTGTWRDIISLSPAEPGISRVKKIPGTSNISVGGWPDLHPTLVLKDIGCKQVVYVTRRGAESEFARLHVATTLGMLKEQDVALFSLKTRESSFSQSLAAADLIYCTNWNSFGTPTKFDEIDADAAETKIYTNGQTKLVKTLNPAIAKDVPVGCRVVTKEEPETRETF